MSPRLSRVGALGARVYRAVQSLCPLWTPVSLTSEGFSIAATPSRWSIVGANYDNATSANGTTWTGDSSTPPLDAVGVYGNTFVGMQYVATYRCTDGISWTLASPLSQGYSFIGSGVYAHGRLVFMGLYNNTTPYMISTPDAGATWTETLLSGPTLRYPRALVATADGFLVFLNNTSTSPYSCQVWASSDGVSWSQRSNLGSSVVNQLAGAAAIGDTVLAVTSYTPTTYLRSTDAFSTWTSVSVPDTAHSWWGLTTVGAAFVFVSLDGYFTTSTDGLSWSTPCAITAFDPGTYVVPSASGNRLLLWAQGISAWLATLDVPAVKTYTWTFESDAYNIEDHSVGLLGTFGANYIWGYTPAHTGNYAAVSYGFYHWGGLTACAATIPLTATKPSAVQLEGWCYFYNDIYSATVTHRLAITQGGTTYKQATSTVQGSWQYLSVSLSSSDIDAIWAAGGSLNVRIESVITDSGYSLWDDIKLTITP